MIKERIIFIPHIIRLGIIVIVMLWFVATAFGQHAATQGEIVTSQTQELNTIQELRPVFSEYKGISIGTTEAELHDRIGTEPTFKSNDDYFFVFSEAESAQFLLDGDRKVKVMSITYSGSVSNAPSYEDVFGKDVTIKITPDGKVYNLVNYPEAGFWVAYYKSTSENTMVTITIQKL